MSKGEKASQNPSWPVAGGTAVPEVLRESWLCLSPAAALSRVASAPHLGNIVELALVG